MRKVLLRAAGVTVCTLAIVAPAMPGHTADAGVVLVTMKDHRFDPQIVEVRLGQTIVFANNDPDLHAVAVAGLLENTFVDPGKELSLAVPASAPLRDYPLACTIHINMTGTIRVAER